MYTSSIDDFAVLIFDFASVVVHARGRRSDHFNICLHIIVMINMTLAFQSLLVFYYYYSKAF